ncbi:expressed unknown protein [Seminavis robusta]|uniref:Uncharacterized protein n=1 Tax=Seminavis robusta TaxID=568900 RepID=A0A9N8E4K7_9STRA|nr:expressed unknown protein [Seminavis robusta]|eukprot:Sro652_g181680.1 n/a (448) ;mRNA; f:7031-8805
MTRTSPRSSGHELPQMPAALESYQQERPLGPGMSKILAQQRLSAVDYDGEEMKRRTRIAYMVLGAVLLCIYFILLKKHVFPMFMRRHHEDPAVSMEGDIRGGSLRVDDRDDIVVTSSPGFLQPFTGEQDCNDGFYSERTLQRSYELSFAALFKDTKGQKKYEASDVILVDGYAYAVCDNSWAISAFVDDLRPFSPENKQIGDPNRETEDSGYEALFHDNGTFYVLRESVFHVEKGDFHAIIEELTLGKDDYEIQAACRSEFVFEGTSKGFEGVLPIRDISNELVVLALCEGNHCSESKKFDRGHGILVAMKKTVAEDGVTCRWDTIRQVNIPSSANFKDYSAITMDEAGRVAISSQEDSAIWVGTLLGKDERTGLWDLDTLHFDQEGGTVYSFPKNDNCETIYCNIEGIHWINPEMIIAVSDKMKSRGGQDFRCFDKDQSVHVFVLP